MAMSTDILATTLKALKLFGMAQAAEELAAQGAPAYQQAAPLLSSLIKAEVAEREVRSVNYQMKAARFPAYRDLAGFVFAESVVSEALIRSLHRCEFLTEAHNVVLIGGPGTGNPSGHRHRRAGDPPPPPAGALLLEHRTG